MSIMHIKIVLLPLKLNRLPAPNALSRSVFLHKRTTPGTTGGKDNKVTFEVKHYPYDILLHVLIMQIVTI